MSESLKDNAHILGDCAAFMEALGRARHELGRLAGVEQVAFGLKQVDGVFRDDICIVAFVAAKKPANELAPDARVPPTFSGYRTDVRASSAMMPAVDIGNDKLINNDKREEIIQGGIQIQTAGLQPPNEPSRGSGTLGCIVKKANDKGRDNVYLLTCEHVLQENSPKHGDMIYHPYAPGNRSRKAATDPTWDTSIVALGPMDLKSGLDGDTTQHEGAYPVRIDAAIAKINIDCTCCAGACICRKDVIRYDTKILGLNIDFLAVPADKRDRISNVRDVSSDPAITQELVCKVGHKTGRTFGRVTAVGAPYRNGHTLVPNPIDKLTNVIEIELAPTPGEPPPTASHPLLNGQGTDSFSEQGDSGSIVLDLRNQAIGMIFAVSPDLDAADAANRAGQPFEPLISHRSSYASLIVPVLDYLNIRIPATDADNQWRKWCAGEAEGWTPGPPATTQLPPENPDKVLFARAGIPSTHHAAADELSAAQRTRLLNSYDALVATTFGRTLREDFDRVHREIIALIRTRRPVTVAWHRHRGPAFLACALNHLKGDAETIPLQIGEVSRASLLVRMSAVLHDNGSPELRECLARHGRVLTALAGAETLNECLDILRSLESAEVTA